VTAGTVKLSRVLSTAGRPGREVQGDQRPGQVAGRVDLAPADLGADQLGGGPGERVVGLVRDGRPVRVVAPGAHVPGAVQPGEGVLRGLDVPDRPGPGHGHVDVEGPGEGRLGGRAHASST
jgi:hypothetical protein